MSRRRAQLVPVLASAVVAMAAAGALAWTLAPRYDELHTLSHLQHPTLGALTSSYRDNRDTLPIAGYVSSWLWAKAAGPGLLVARIPMVASWGIVAASLSVLTRRMGPWASFVAGIVPSATALVFLGAFARPYAPALAAAGAGLVCWQRAGERDRVAWWLAGAAMAFAVASSLHYAVSAVAMVVVAATWWPAGQAHRVDRSACVALGGLLPLVASTTLIGSAVEDQGRLPRSVGPADAIAFWPSTLRPGVPLLALALVLAVVARAGRSSGAGGPARAERSSLDAPLVGLGVALVLVVPLATVVAMALTSGTYVHRYAMGALLGAGLLAAWMVRWAQAATTSVLGRVVGPALAAIALAAVGASVAGTRADMVGADRATVLAAELRSAEGTVFVRDEYDAALLRWAALEDPRSASWREITAEPAFTPLEAERTIAGSPHPASLSELMADPDRTAIEVVVPVGQRDALLDEVARGWRAEVVGAESYPRPGGRWTLVRVLLRRG